METLKNIKGQISVATVITALIGIALAAASGYGASLAATSNEIGKVRDVNTVQTAEIAVLRQMAEQNKEDHIAMKKDIGDTREKVDWIKGALMANGIIPR